MAQDPRAHRLLHPAGMRKLPRQRRMCFMRISSRHSGLSLLRVGRTQRRVTSCRARYRHGCVNCGAVRGVTRQEGCQPRGCQASAGCPERLACGSRKRDVSNAHFGGQWKGFRGPALSWRSARALPPSPARGGPRRQTPRVSARSTTKPLNRHRSSPIQAGDRILRGSCGFREFLDGDFSDSRTVL